MTPKLTKVIRLDSLQLNQTYYTDEGYLIDRPILTSTGIFEYHNADGTVRRELRLPEEVFNEESLKSYKGKPIIITHDAGLVDKKNVHDHSIGSILTDGYRSGNDVRAEIIIHDTNEMKRSGLKELSLGYNLDLDETPGEWNGQKYDAIQRNIRINHLALVREARAGEQARLNIDSRDQETILKGGKVMSNPKKTQHGDGVLSQEELAQAIEEYKKRRAAKFASAAPKKDGEKPVEETVPAAKPAIPAAAASAKPVAPAAGAAKPVVPGANAKPTTPAATAAPATPAEKPVKDGEEPAFSAAGEKKPKTIEEQVKDIKERQDKFGEPADKEEAMGVIEKKDEDMGFLYDIIDTLLAQKDFGKTDCDDNPFMKKDSEDEDPEEEHEDGEDEDEDEEKPDATDGEEKAIPMVNATPAHGLNTDSIDAIVRERIKVGMIGRSINLDGLEDMRIRDAKKAIINAVRPGLRLDGKGDAYINAAYDMAVQQINAENYSSIPAQKKQMFNKDSRNSEDTNVDSASNARERMIARQLKINT